MYGVTESTKNAALTISDRESEENAVAPRVSLPSMEQRIQTVTYIVHESILTLCILKMRNGFYVVGEAAPASPENFNAELGRKFAYENAIRQLWKLEGYALREQLSKRKEQK
jgi:hypothetical protein